MPAPSAGPSSRRSALLAAALLLAPPPARSYPDGPPPGHTGGFGEPTCRACHADNPLNAPGGSLALGGLPAVYQPGASYRLTVTLGRRDLRRAGFQLAARFDSGVTAGSLTPLDSSVAVTPSPAGVSYAHQTRAGSTRRETAAWTLEWRAPDSARATVAFHVAANAANDDASEFGDFIYTQTTRAESEPGIESVKGTRSPTSRFGPRWRSPGWAWGAARSPSTPRGPPTRRHSSPANAGAGR